MAGGWLAWPQLSPPPKPHPFPDLAWPHLATVWQKRINLPKLSPQSLPSPIFLAASMHILVGQKKETNIMGPLKKAVYPIAWGWINWKLLTSNNSSMNPRYWWQDAWSNFPIPMPKCSTNRPGRIVSTRHQQVSQVNNPGGQGCQGENSNISLLQIT